MRASLRGCRRRTLLSLRAFRTFWQVVYAVMGTIVLVGTNLPVGRLSRFKNSHPAGLRLLPARPSGARNPRVSRWRAPDSRPPARLSHLVDSPTCVCSRPAPEPNTECPGARRAHLRPA